MSFSQDVKNELYDTIDSARHCRIAELAALIRFCGKKDEDGALIFETGHPELLHLYVRLLKLVFHLEEGIEIRDSARKKTDFCLARVGDRDAVARILHTTDAPTPVHSVVLQRNCCRRAFLRGAFLAAGSVSDPNRSYHFEIVCETPETAEDVCGVLRLLETDARIVKRQRYDVVYVKESAQISDLIGMMGANVSLLNFENVRIVREVRGGVNRKVNCETANIEKTATAAARQIDDIRYIEKTVGFSKLSKALDEMAEIRLQYPTATLAELGKLLNPPVSKSGVNHRLRELSRIADDLRNTRRQ